MPGLFESSKEAIVAGVKEEVKEAMWCMQAIVQGTREGF